MIVVAIIGILAAVAIPAFMSYMKKSRSTEAMLQLNKMAKNDKANFVARAAYYLQPDGVEIATAPNPAAPCCTQDFGGQKKCDPATGNWTNSDWVKLDFQMDEAHYFQYTYTGGGNPTGVSGVGRNYRFTAVGDLDCDGTSITYTLDGDSIRGNPSNSISSPAANAD
jgi:type IV pilus assembly protein PilA